MGNLFQNSTQVFNQSRINKLLLAVGTKAVTRKWLQNNPPTKTD